MIRKEAFKELWNTDPEYRETVSNAIRFGLKGYVKYRDLRLHAEKKVSRRWHKKKWETLLDDYRYLEKKTMESASKWIAAILEIDMDKAREMVSESAESILKRTEKTERDIDNWNPYRREF